MSDRKTVQTVRVVIPMRAPPARITAVADSLRMQTLGPGVEMEVCVVCDGGRVSAKAVDALSGIALETIDSPTHIGRAAARNLGARNAQSDALLLLDADCWLGGEDVVSAHLRALAGADISVGPIMSSAAGFWQILRNRRNDLPQDATMPVDRLHTANCMIRRDAFEVLAGFDTGYVGYGFEDRDLLLRAVAADQRIVFAPDAGAVHDDTGLRVMDYCAKLNEAARLTAPRFARAHPSAYKASAYGALDVRLGGLGRRMAARAAGPAALRLGRLADAVIHRPWLPFRVRRLLMSACGALGYLAGSAGLVIQAPASEPPAA